MKVNRISGVERINKIVDTSHKQHEKNSGLNNPEVLYTGIIPQSDDLPQSVDNLKELKEQLKYIQEDIESKGRINPFKK